MLDRGACQADVFGHDFGHNLGDDFSLYVLGHDVDDARTRGAVELEMRSRDAHGRDRRLGDRHDAAIGDQQRGAAKVDAAPDRRDGVKLFERPAEQRRLIAPALVEEALEAASRHDPALRLNNLAAARRC